METITFDFGRLRQIVREVDGRLRCDLRYVLGNAKVSALATLGSAESLSVVFTRMTVELDVRNAVGDVVETRVFGWDFEANRPL